MASFRFANAHYVGVMPSSKFLRLWLMPVLLVAACSRPDNASGAGGISAGEARSLDDAAEMLQNQQLPIAAIPVQKTPAVKQVSTKAPPKTAG